MIPRLHHITIFDLVNFYSPCMYHECLSMNPDRGSRYVWTDDMTNLLEIRRLKQLYLSICICETPPGTPQYTPPLHVILPIHRPTVYVYVYAIINSTNITISVRVVTTSISLPCIRNLSTTSAAIGIRIFLLLPDFYLICLNFYN